MAGMRECRRPGRILASRMGWNGFGVGTAQVDVIVLAPRHKPGTRPFQGGDS